MAKKKKEEKKTLVSPQPAVKPSPKFTTSATSAPANKSLPAANTSAPAGKQVEKSLPAKSGGQSSSAKTPAASSGKKGSAAMSRTSITAQLRNDLGIKASHKERRQAFGEGLKKNFKAGIDDILGIGAVGDLRHTYVHYDPEDSRVFRKNEQQQELADRDRERVWSTTGRYSDAFDQAHATDVLLDELLDPKNRYGATREGVDAKIAKIDERYARRQEKEQEAEAATEEAFGVIDPQSWLGNKALQASMSVAHEAPSLAADAALTVLTDGTYAALKGPAAAAKYVARIPTFTTRSARYYNDAYQQAIDNGATQEQAVEAALETAVPQAAIEAAGGLDKLALGLVGKTAAKEAGKATAAGAARALARIGVEEGLEEVGQGVVERGAAKRNYDEDMLVWDLNKIVDEFSLGFMGAVIVGGGMKLAKSAINPGSKKQLSDNIKEEAARQGVPVSDWEAEQVTEQIADKAESWGVIDKLRTNITRLEKMKPVASLTGAEFSPKPGLRLSDQVAEFFKSMGDAVTREGFGLVNLTKRGIKSDISHGVGRAKAIAFGAIPDVIQYGEQIDFQENWAGRGEDSYIFAAPVSVGDNIEYMGVVVLRGSDNHYYLHEVVDTNGNIIKIQKDSAPENIKTTDYGQARITGNSEALSNNNIAQTEQENNTQSSIDAVLGSMGLSEQVQTPPPVQENAAESLARPLTATNETKKTRGTYGLNVPQGEGSEQQFGFGNTLNQAAEAGVVDEEIATEMQGRNYKTVTNKQSLSVAQSSINKYGPERIYNYLQRRSRDNSGFNSIEYAAALQLIRHFSDTGKIETAQTVADMAAAVVNDAGRLVQLSKTLALSSPELHVLHSVRKARASGTEMSAGRRALIGAVAKIVKQMEDGTWDGRADFREVQTALQSNPVGIVANPDGGRVTQEPELTDDELNKWKNEIENLRKDPKTAKQVAASGVGEAEWASRILLAIEAQAVRPRATDIVNAYRRINMLGNTATLLVRNPGGNATITLMEEAADVPASVFGKIVQLLFKGDFNAAGLGGIKAYGEGFKQGWNEALLAYKTGTIGLMGHKYGDATPGIVRLTGGTGSPGAGIKGAAQKGAGLFLHGLQSVSDALSFIMTVGDATFRNARTAQVEAQFKRGLERSGQDTELTTEMRTLAEDAGERTTFTQQSGGSSLAMALRGIGRAIQTSGERADPALGKNQVAFGKLIDGIMHLEMPFVQVAGNILSTIFDYSKVGGIVNASLEMTAHAIETMRGEHGFREMPFDRQRRIAMAAGRAVIGMGLLSVGGWLAEQGLATGDAPDKDSLEGRAWAAEGKQGNSLKIGNSWMDLTAIGPLFTLLAIGATMYQDKDLEEELDEQARLKYITHILKQVFHSADYILDNISDDQIWSGFTDLVGSLQDENNKVDFDGLKDAIFGNLGSQFLPAAAQLRRFAYAIDPYVRETSGADDKAWRENKRQAGLPSVGLFDMPTSTDLPQARDINGEPIKRYPDADTDAKRWINAMINPASKISKIDDKDPVTREIIDIAEYADDKKLLPEKAPYSLKDTDKEIFKLFGEERAQYQETLSGNYRDMVRDLLFNPDYGQLDKDQKADALSDLKNIASYQALEEFAAGNPKFDISESSDAAKLMKKVNAAAEMDIDTPTYIIYEIAMDQDYNFRYREGDKLPKNKAVGDTISSGSKKGSAWAIQQQFAGELNADQMYFLWTLENSNTKEVEAGGTNNEYYRFFAEGNWSYDRLFNAKM